MADRTGKRVEGMRAPGRFTPLVWLAAAFLAIEAALRLALLARIWPELEGDPGTLVRVLVVGLCYDLAALPWAALAFGLYLGGVPSRLHRTGAGRTFLHACFLLAISALLFSAIAEWLFFDEFGARFNFIAVDYLVYTREVVADVWESYPVAWLLLGLLALAAAAWWPLRARLAASCGAPAPALRRIAVVVSLASAAWVSFRSVDDRWLGVIEGHPASEVAKSGLFELFSAFRNNELDYDPFYASTGADEALRRAHVLLEDPNAPFVSAEPTELARNVRSGNGGEERLNVVLVVVESLSAEFLGAYGSHLDLTPQLDALAERSLVFTDLYATGNRTVRGLEAVALSMPPTPGASIVRRPGNDHLFTLGSPFRARGYDVRFLYGGFAAFDNMGPFFAGNGFEVLDRLDFPDEEVGFSNAWGVADEDLFRRVIREGDRSAASGRPFFSLVLTTSNHRPYTYPDGRVAIPSHTGRNGAVQYTDWALGDFLRQAESRPWFGDTVFVIVADHCASSSGKTEIPVRRYHIPLLVFAPGHVEPGRVETLASQIDVGPTLLGLLGFGYRSPSFGRDLLQESGAEPRALLATYQRLGLLAGGMLTILSPKQRVDAFRVEARSGREVEAVADPGLLADAIAYYASASFVWSHGLLREASGAATPP